MKLRSLLLAGSVMVVTSCAGTADSHRYDAEYSAWAMELTWKHEWEAPQAPDTKAGSYRFESLKLVLKPGRIGEDQLIDGSAVAGTFMHGGADWCPKAHRVTGKMCLLELGSTNVRARVDAVLHCPDAQPVALKGDFTFETKVPP